MKANQIEELRRVFLFQTAKRRAIILALGANTKKALWKEKENALCICRFSTGGCSGVFAMLPAFIWLFHIIHPTTTSTTTIIYYSMFNPFCRLAKWLAAPMLSLL